MSILMADAPTQQTDPVRRSRTPLAAASIAYVALVAWITLGPQSAVSAFRASAESLLEVVLIPFAPLAGLVHLLPSSLLRLAPDVDFEVVANVLMFVPLGALAALWFRGSSWFALTMAGVAASCAIEVTQFFIPGRVPDAGDVVANGIGMAVGALVITVARLLDRLASVVEAAPGR